VACKTGGKLPMFGLVYYLKIKALGYECVEEYYAQFISYWNIREVEKLYRGCHSSLFTSGSSKKHVLF
jgi:hypothetical protein